MKTLAAGGAGAPSPSFHGTTGTNFAVAGAGAGLGGTAAPGAPYAPVPSPDSALAMSGPYYQNSEPDKYYGQDGGYTPSPPPQEHFGLAPMAYNPSPCLSPAPYLNNPEIQDGYGQTQPFLLAPPGSQAPSGSPPQWGVGEGQGYGGEQGGYRLAPPIMNEPVSRFPTPGHGLSLPGAPATPAPGVEGLRVVQRRRARVARRVHAGEVRGKRARCVKGERVGYMLFFFPGR